MRPHAFLFGFSDETVASCHWPQLKPQPQPQSQSQSQCRNPDPTELTRFLYLYKTSSVGVVSALFLPIARHARRQRWRGRARAVAGVWDARGKSRDGPEDMGG